MAPPICFVATSAAALAGCAAAAPSPAAPQNLPFRSFRLEDARPAGYGYSVILDQRVWKRILQDRLPGDWRRYGDSASIDLTTHSLVILHATSGTQCFDQPVVQRVTRKGDTTRVVLGSLMGVCPMTDDWIEVIELPRLQGPVRLDYPLHEFRPSWIEKEIRLPLDPAVAGFAAAPDSVPAWIRADSSVVPGSRHIPASFIRNVVAVRFDSWATPAQRRAAIEMVDGKLVGGHRRMGVYLVQVKDPGDGSGIERAAERFRALPYVVTAIPDFVLAPD